MAQVDGAVTGLMIDASCATREDSADDDDAVAQKLLDAYRAHKRKQFKAAAAHAVDAVNMLAADFGVMCGASL